MAVKFTVLTVFCDKLCVDIGAVKHLKLRRSGAGMLLAIKSAFAGDCGTANNPLSFHPLTVLQETLKDSFFQSFLLPLSPVMPARRLSSVLDTNRFTYFYTRLLMPRVIS